MARGGLLLFLICLCAPVSGRAETADDVTIDVAHRAVSLGEVTDVAMLPPFLRGQAAALVVAEIPPGHRSLVTSMSRVHARARAALPALGSFPADAEVRIKLTFTGEEPPAAAQRAPTLVCVRALRPVPNGAVLTDADLGPAACGGAPPEEPYRFDRTARSLVSIRTLAQDEILGAPPAFAVAGARPGDALTVSTRVGPVVIQRSVEAVQPGRPGRPLFVRTADGDVFPALLPRAAH